jgi:hypothetical protein
MQGSASPLGIGMEIALASGIDMGMQHQVWPQHWHQSAMALALGVATNIGGGHQHQPWPLTSGTAMASASVRYCM